MNLGAYLSKEEVQGLVRPSNARAFAAFATDWGLIAGAMALVAWRPSVLTVVAGLVLIGGRQLGLAVLMHECAHGILFRTPGLNRLFGRWFAARPTYTNLDRYRTIHLLHHKYTATERDPDLSLTTGFPTTPRSMARKVWRDLSGRTGLKRVVGLTMIETGDIAVSSSGHFSRADASGRTWRDRLRAARENLLPIWAFQGALLALLAALGHPWLILLWWGAYLTTFSLVLRIRSIAEHACTPDPADPLGNTRTTLAGPLARLLLAPHGVNYHLEHHLIMTVPSYHLAKMHALLRDRGALDGACVAPGYGSVLRGAVAAA